MPEDTPPQSLAIRLFDEAFARPRDPRSTAYQRGVLDTLRFRAGERHIQPTSPYQAGTAEHDAYLAGSDEGKHLWRRHLAKQDKPA